MNLRYAVFAVLAVLASSTAGRAQSNAVPCISQLRGRMEIGSTVQMYATSAECQKLFGEELYAFELTQNRPVSLWVVPSPDFYVSELYDKDGEVLGEFKTTPLNINLPPGTYYVLTRFGMERPTGRVVELKSKFTTTLNARLSGCTRATALYGIFLGSPMTGTFDARSCVRQNEWSKEWLPGAGWFLTIRQTTKVTGKLKVTGVVEGAFLAIDPYDDNVDLPDYDDSRPDVVSVTLPPGRYFVSIGTQNPRAHGTYEVLLTAAAAPVATQPTQPQPQPATPPTKACTVAATSHAIQAFGTYSIVLTTNDCSDRPGYYHRVYKFTPVKSGLVRFTISSENTKPLMTLLQNNAASNTLVRVGMVPGTASQGSIVAQVIANTPYYLVVANPSPLSAGQTAVFALSMSERLLIDRVVPGCKGDLCGEPPPHCAMTLWTLRDGVTRTSNMFDFSTCVATVTGEVHHYYVLANLTTGTGVNITCADDKLTLSARLIRGDGSIVNEQAWQCNPQTGYQLPLLRELGPVYLKLIARTTGTTRATYSIALVN